MLFGSVRCSHACKNKCDTIEEFNVDYKADCGQLNLGNLTKNEKKIKEETQNEMIVITTD